jgi:hypothetical protein
VGIQPAVTHRGFQRVTAAGIPSSTAAPGIQSATTSPRCRASDSASGDSAQRSSGQTATRNLWGSPALAGRGSSHVSAEWGQAATQPCRETSDDTGDQPGSNIAQAGKNDDDTGGSGQQFHRRASQTARATGRESGRVKHRVSTTAAPTALHRFTKHRSSGRHSAQQGIEDRYTKSRGQVGGNTGQHDDEQHPDSEQQDSLHSRTALHSIARIPVRVSAVQTRWRRFQQSRARGWYQQARIPSERHTGQRGVD